MKRLLAAAALVLAAPALAAAAPQPSEFRWTRSLTAEPGAGPISFTADPQLFAHAGPGFSSMRVFDAEGEQVPWRPYPEEPTIGPRQLRLLNQGRSGGAAVALADLGPRRRVLRRIELDLPGHGYVGTATVWGSDDRRTFTRIGTSRVFDLAGPAEHAHSTVVTFSPSDFRYLRLRATGVRSIDGASVVGGLGAASPVPIPATVRGNVLDLGGANVPVEQLEVTSSASRYVRSVRVEARNPGQAWYPVAQGRIFRLYGVPSRPLDLGVRARYLRVRIANGDDPPLPGVRYEARAYPRTILVEGGHAEPLSVMYGGRPRSAPHYEFARLPRGELDLDQVRRGLLGDLDLNTGFEAAPDTRSWVKRHPAAISAALALAAAVVGVAGVLALRRRA